MIISVGVDGVADDNLLVNKEPGTEQSNLGSSRSMLNTKNML